MHRFIRVLFVGVILLYLCSCDRLFSCVFRAKYPDRFYTQSIVNDSKGSSYLFGWFHGKVSFGHLSLQSHDSPNKLGLFDAFLTKMDRNKRTFLWAVRIGGLSDDSGSDVSVDSKGNVYIVGNFSGKVTFGHVSLESKDSSQVYIAKLNSKGTFLWATQVKGSSRSSAVALDVDLLGNTYVTGHFSGLSKFDTLTLRSQKDSRDVFIAKLNTQGKFLWARQAGGSYKDMGSSIKVDKKGNVYISGFFQQKASFQQVILTSQRKYGAYVAKLSPQGNFLWAKNVSNSSKEPESLVVTDNKENVYFAAHFEKKTTLGRISLRSKGKHDIVVAKVGKQGNVLWAISAGGIADDFVYQMKIDAQKNIYIIGQFQQTAHFGRYSLRSRGGSDIFVAKLDPRGQFLWVSQAGGAGDDIGKSLDLDVNKNLYIFGSFEKKVHIGAFSLSSRYKTGLFVSKLDNNGTFLWAMQ